MFFSYSSPSLTDDILIEIFAHLPLNSIYKFKCLSKVWLSNLSNPNFIKKWFQINSKFLPWIQYHSITHNSYDTNPMKFGNAYPDLHSEFMSRNQHLLSFKFLMNEKPFRGSKLHLLDSSNGLVLCSVSLYHGTKTYNVCNPLTRKWVSIPSPPRPQAWHAIEFIISGIFNVHPSSSYTSCYKVLVIPNFYKPLKKFNVHIFSSDLGEWESFHASCDENVECDWCTCNNFVILNDVLYWIPKGRRMLVYNLNQNNGTDIHQCSLINLPDEEFDTSHLRCDRRIGKSKGRICYAKTTGNQREMTMSVWVLHEVKWQLLHKGIPVDDILADLQSRVNGRGYIQVTGFSPVDHNVVLLSWKNRVWGFNLLTRSVEDLWGWGFNTNTRTVEEIHSDNQNVYSSGMFPTFLLMPMPTELPPPSWIDI